MLNKTKRLVSKQLKLKNDYEAFCVDEAALYVYMKWKAGEHTYIEKVMAQNKGLKSKARKATNYFKNKLKARKK